MKKKLLVLGLSLSLLVAVDGIAQDAKGSKEKAKKEMKEAGAKATTDAAKQQAINDRMAAARAAKAAKKAGAEGTAAATTTADRVEKKADKMAANAGAGLKDDKMSKSASTSAPKMKEEKATPADYKAPVDPSQKGPNGEKVMTGPRGGKYYINKNGNKTYLSSGK